MTRVSTKWTLGVLLAFSSAHAADPDWTKLARRLTGEGEGVRAQTIAKLRKVPELEAALKQALSADRPFLALDVIVALNLRTLWSEVIHASEKDRSGFSYLALDALVDDPHEPGLAKLYKERLVSKDTSAASKVVILDSLLRMSERLAPENLAPLLLDDPSPEVKSAALYYARSFLIRHDKGYLPMFQHFKEGKLSKQLKAQSDSLANELTDAKD